MSKDRTDSGIAKIDALKEALAIFDNIADNFRSKIIEQIESEKKEIPKEFQVACVDCSMVATVLAANREQAILDLGTAVNITGAPWTWGTDDPYDPNSSFVYRCRECSLKHAVSIELRRNGTT